MPDYRAPLKDMQFILHDVFEAESQWQNMEGTSHCDRDTADAILGEGAKLAAEVCSPINRSGDEEGVSWNDGVVTTPKGFKEAWVQIAEGGWLGLSGNPEYGGMDMPKMLTGLFEEMMYGGNLSLFLYQSLTMGAALTVNAHGSDELKSKYVPKLYSGQWAGSMCLTEPHSGTDLGIIRTKAEPNADGSYQITGSKIFITGGEHDLAENIIHLVLAKLPDSPAGSKGISLFLVPKITVNEDDSLSGPNGVSCGSTEHKMGIHASATCVMNFDDAKGWLIGEPNQGLACMFTMMNYERLSVGIQGLGCGAAAYQGSLDYARERLQGRAATGVTNPDGPADPIIVHPDVRRMLLTQRAYVEAGRAFGVHVGQQLDISKHGEGEAKTRAAGQVQLLTPIAKAFMTDKGLEGALHGQLIFGGHGYLREWGMEQLVRDARIAQIYEGTNGVQANDLAGRKVVFNGGKDMASMIAEIRQFCSDNASLADLVEPLGKAVDNLEELTNWLLAAAKEDRNAINASAVDFLNAAGYTVYGWMWAKMAAVALKGDAGNAYLKGKVETARFYMQRILPNAFSAAEQVRAGSQPLMAIEDEGFDVF